MTRIVLVHGAFSGAWTWEPIVPALQSAGHDVETLDLPGSGADHTPVAEVSLEAYAERICETLARGPRALLVGNSMGGVAVTQAAARCPELIAGLAYVAAFLPAEGQSLSDLTQLPEGAADQIQASMVVEGDPPTAFLPGDAARTVIYNCCSDEVAAWAVPQRRPQPVLPFTQPISVPEPSRAAYEALPRAYVVCGQDRAIPPALQWRMLRAAGCDPVIELDTDHVPWLSRPQEFLAAIEQILAGVGAAV